MKKLLLTFTSIIFCCILIRVGLGEICSVPSASMEPTILTGDWLWIDKATYGAKLPERWADIPLINVFTWNDYLREADEKNDWKYHRLTGYKAPQLFDIVVFKSPENEALLLVKRITHIISAGETIVLTPQNYDLLKSIPEQENIAINKQSDKIYINGKQDSAYQVKQNHYFVSGDNSSNSRDSRTFGYISETAIVGKMNLVLFSLDKTKKGFHKIRFNRFFHIIR